MAFTTLTTHASLLSKIRAGDEAGWGEFYKTYKPLIMSYGTKRGLLHSELDELVQNTVMTVFEGREKFHYDRAKGKFRGFLGTIIKCRAVDIMRKRHYDRNQPLPEEDILPEKSQSEIERIWDEEWNAHVLNESLKELRAQLEPETYQAFELYKLKDNRGKKVAEFLGMSEDAVYVAQHRAMKKLREIIKTIKE